jgi:hypothetical protein
MALRPQPDSELFTEIGLYRHRAAATIAAYAAG